MKFVRTFVGLLVIVILLALLWVLITPPSTVECKTDEDCIPDEPLVGVTYYCDDGVCETKPLGNPLYCERNEDCVPAQCCHPDSCINIEYRPDCEGIFCTMECQPGTMDCGRGYCACVDNTCQVMWTS